MLQKKNVEIRCQRLSTKLPHRQRELTSMIGGVVDDVLHQVHQGEPRSTKGEHFRQALIGHPIYEFGLLQLDFYPLRLESINVRKCLRTEEGVASRSQF
jgi:hypothetical protein